MLGLVYQTVGAYWAGLYFAGLGQDFFLMLDFWGGSWHGCGWADGRIHGWNGDDGYCGVFAYMSALLTCCCGHGYTYIVARQLILRRAITDDAVC
ncbi:hypothetical protein GGI43DRAFT_408103, partial [Trichoderma evansii]